MSAPFTQTYAEITGWRYSSGDGHFAFDYETPLGTPVFAVADGVILDCNDGQSNYPPYRYSGMPSNWILLGMQYQGQDVSVYYQHLSPVLNVHRGQHVRDGDLIAHSGNSGNSTGPHCHIAAMFYPHSQSNEATRYVYMNNDGSNPYVIFPPDQVWKDEPMTPEDKQWLVQHLNDAVARQVRNETWGHKIKAAPGSDARMTFHEVISRWQSSRTVEKIAEASAQATLDALDQAGALPAHVDSAAIAKKVAAKLVNAFPDVFDPTDTVPAGAPDPLP